MRRKRSADGLLTTTDVVGQLYQRGVPVSRDRLSEMTDVLFDPEEIRRGPGSHRRFAPHQVDLLAAAFRLHWDLGVERHRLAALLRDPETAEEINAQLQSCVRDLEALRNYAAKGVSA